MNHEDTITLSGYSRYHSPTRSTEITHTLTAWANITEVLETFKQIALGLGYVERSWDEAILRMAGEIEDSRAGEAIIHHGDCECSICEYGPHRASRAYGNYARTEADRA